MHNKEDKGLNHPHFLMLCPIIRLGIAVFICEPYSTDSSVKKYSIKRKINMPVKL